MKRTLFFLYTACLMIFASEQEQLPILPETNLLIYRFRMTDGISNSSQESPVWQDAVRLQLICAIPADKLIKGEQAH